MQSRFENWIYISFDLEISLTLFLTTSMKLTNIKLIHTYKLLNVLYKLCTITMQVAVSNKKLVQRRGHSAASFAISPECMEVVLFGGQNTSLRNITDTTVLRFGKVLCHTTHL